MVAIQLSISSLLYHGDGGPQVKEKLTGDKAGVGQTSKEAKDGAWPGASFPALARQPPKGVAGTLKVGDLGVERLDAGLCKLAGTAAVFAGVQLQKLPDLLQREPCRLRLPDEPQPAHILPAVAPDPAPARRRPEQAPALVEADRLDAYAARGGELADGEQVRASLDSVPWYGTYISADRISRRPNMSATTILSPAPSHPAVAKKAVIHRMVMPHHTCPYGLKAKDLLQRPATRSRTTT